MGTEDQLEVTGQASVSDLADEDVLINYCFQNKIAKPAINKLLNSGFDSLEALALVDSVILLYIYIYPQNTHWAT